MEEDIRQPVADKVRQIFSELLKLLQMIDPHQMMVEEQDLINKCFRVSTQETQANSIPLLVFYVQLRKIFFSCQLTSEQFSL